MGENIFGFGERVRLTVDAQERQPDIGHAIGTVLDLGDGAAKVRWPRGESWHKAQDLEQVATETTEWSIVKPIFKNRQN